MLVSLRILCLSVVAFVNNNDSFNIVNIGSDVTGCYQYKWLKFGSSGYEDRHEINDVRELYDASTLAIRM